MQGTNFDPDHEPQPTFFGRVKSIFPTRQFILRTEHEVRSVSFPGWLQASAAVLALGVAGWTGFTSYVYLQNDRLLDRHERAAQEADLRYESLLAQVSDYQRRVDAITQELEVNHGQMMAMANQNSQLKENLEAVQSRLISVAEERREIEERREDLKQRLAGLNREMDGLSTANYSLVEDLQNTRSQLASVIQQRVRTAAERDALQSEVNGLKETLVSLEGAQGQVVSRLSKLASETIGELETTLAMTRIDVERLVRREQKTEGLGGPFVALPVETQAATALKEDILSLNDRLARWEALNTLLSTLPLKEPVLNYRVTSPFGPRRDPFNGRVSMHSGIDLGARSNTPVHAPSPARVKFVGWRGAYGRLVELDHGNGITTRYAHLRQILVKEGETVNPGDKIGLVGSSGRSSGPHLHYEVRVDNNPVDPHNFIKAGHHVLKK